MRRLILFTIFGLGLWADTTEAMSGKGRVNTSLLFLTDNFGGVIVTDVYENQSCQNPGELKQTVYGKERDRVNCEQHCCEDRVLMGNEVVLERYSADGEAAPIRDIGSSLYWNLGTNLEGKLNDFTFKLNGRFTQSVLKERTLYGTESTRYRLTEKYVQYERLDLSVPFQVSLGRRPVGGGATVDGISGQYYFGPKASPRSKSIGAFVGLAPHPVTKKVDTDFKTFGANFRWIPDFSQASESKLFFDSALVAELYDGSFNRLYLQSRAHFTPFKKLSFVHMSTLELPATGDDSGLRSGYFSLQALLRPNPRWNFSLGFSQFRIGRFLSEESIKNILQDPLQADRLGDTIDRSQRYRLDFRTAFKATPSFEIYQRSRIERRSFDADKGFLNNPDLPLDKEDRDLPPENLDLLSSRFLYQVTGGVRTYLREDLETDTSFSYRNRYRSKAYDIWHFMTWMPSQKWFVDFEVSAIFSERDILSSMPSAPSKTFKAFDYYAGIGGSYRLRQNLWSRLRYDFLNERDHATQERFVTHSIFARLDWNF